MQAAGKILGIDIGATTVKFAALDAEGRLGQRSVLPIAASGNEAFLDQLAGIIGDAAFADCDRIGIGSPGPLDTDGGIIIFSANMPHVRDCKVVPELKKRFPQKEIRLDNDANAATLGEKFFGAGKGVANFAVFTLGTGVGGGCVYENKLYQGYKGNFFEVGHMPVFGVMANSRICGCSNRGCLEAYASATGVTATYKEAKGDVLTAEEIARRAHAGDAAALHAYTLAAKALGLAAATITQLMNITHFIFTGGMAAADALLKSEIENTYRSHTFPLFHPLVKLTFTQGDENAGICGAAALFL
jgi:glucokinase